jgi:histidine decarboxylase
VLFKPLLAAQQQRLDELLAAVKNEADFFLGYPCNREFDYSPLYPFLSYPLNNVGDPFTDSNYHLNTHAFEREVIDFFAKLTRAGDERIWGYVTNGGTEGNLYGIYLGRELFPDGIVYYSEDTHYSVAKILRMLHVRNIMIRSQPNGEMDYHDLAETINIHRDVPPIIFANIGTTMKGAVDDLDKIRAILKEHAIERHYIHADAALGGMILPFVEHPQGFGFDAGIDSISISGHKMVGSPIPCGVALAKKAHVERIARGIEYIGTLDTTVSGSRNAITPLFLWYAMHALGFDGFKQAISGCLQTADYAIRRFHETGLGEAWRNENSITVVFPKQHPNVLKRWQIAVHGQWAHIVVMPHVKPQKIDAFIADLLNAND